MNIIFWLGRVSLVGFGAAAFQGGLGWIIVWSILASVAGVIRYRIFAPVRKLRREFEQEKRKAEHRIMGYREGNLEEVEFVHGLAVVEFRKRIREHRDSTLGHDSEWGKAHAKLQSAADEADRARMYWERRARREPDNQVLQKQNEEARLLDERLQRALTELDGKASALKKFYNHCDTRLAAMDRSNDDMREMRRFEELSRRAGGDIATAKDTLESIARNFAQDVFQMEGALSDLSEIGMKNLAGKSSLDDIALLADQVIDSAEKDRAAIEELQERLYVDG